MKKIDLTWYNKNCQTDLEDLINDISYGEWVINGCYDSTDVSFICSKDALREIARFTTKDRAYETDFGMIILIEVIKIKRD